MRLIKWKTMISDPHSFEYDEYRLKGTLVVEDDSLGQDDIRWRIENKILSQEQKDNRVSKITIKQIPIV